MTADSTEITPDPFEQVLYDHREGAMVCFNHIPTADEQPRPWCCVCGEHRITVSWRAHVAAALREQVEREGS